MAATDLDEATFESHRPLLFSIAYSMLGSTIEAEDEATRARAEVEAEIIATLTNGGASKIKRNGYAVQLKTPKDKDGLDVLEIRSA